MSLENIKFVKIIDFDYDNHVDLNKCNVKDCNCNKTHYGILHIDNMKIYIHVCENHIDDFSDIHFEEINYYDDSNYCNFDYCSEKPTHSSTLIVNDIILEIPMCKLHHMELSTLRKDENNNLIKVPVFKCKKEGKQLVFFCPYCLEEHRHGAGMEGHREAHCRLNKVMRNYGYYVISKI